MRVISPRDARYNVEVGRHLRVVEHGRKPGSMYYSIDKLFGAPTVAKNMNALEVATLIVGAYNDIVDPIVLTLDATRFDQHCGVHALVFEHGIYNAVFKSPFLQKLLSWQLKSVGRGFLDDGRIKCVKVGGRCSGDMNTAMGNVIIMTGLIWTYMRKKGIKYRLVNNGDDSNLVISRCDRSKLDDLQPWFEKMGYGMKIENETSVLEKVVFCQSQPVFTARGWIMVRQLKAIMKDLATNKDVKSEASWNAQRGAIASCGKALCAGVPVMQAYYEMIGRGTKREAKNMMETGMQYAAAGLVSGASINEAARVSFAIAFDISPVEQEDIEQQFTHINIKHRAWEHGDTDDLFPTVCIPLIST